MRRGSVIGFEIIALVLVVSHAMAQTTTVYQPVSAEHVKATASSSFGEFDVSATINGDGMKNHRHQSHNLGRGMWISKISTSPVRAHPNTKEGIVWLMYTFDKPERVDLLEIWNHNQHNHLNRGLQKVYLQYSMDGEHWTTLRQNGNDFFILPKSGGERYAPPTFSLKLSGLTFKYLCITADSVSGNYYHDGTSRTLENAKIQNQDVNYYGLSEIRFYQKKRRRVSELPEITEGAIAVSQGYRKSPEGPRREFTLSFDVPLYVGGKVTVRIQDREVIETIPPSEMGIYSCDLQFPPGMIEEAQPVNFHFTSDQGNFGKVQQVAGARAWTVWFLPHSHLDIGYTHPHEKVMDLQLRNIDLALELIEKSKDLPEASQFKWNIETMWPLVEFKKRYKGTAKWNQLRRAVQSGHIGLNASLGNILTGLCKQEELMHLFDDGIDIGRELGVDVNSVMMSDVPGFSWGVVTAMAANGLKYFSMAPNFVPYLKTGGSRVGLSHIEWADRPFYWQSQSGEEQVLCWSAGTGYSYFHDWLAGPLSSAGLQPVWEYLERREKEAFPYDMTYFRYTVNGDNGPPDEKMAALIQAWNEKYESPQFVIGTTEQLFSKFEAKYRGHIPTFKGDFTPYWEDGAASTAATLGRNRRNSERLNQAEILWSMAGPADYPFEDFRTGWRNIVLFSEHTWGASASVTAPEAALTKKLWSQKRNFALVADSLANSIDEGIEKQLSKKGKTKYVQVFNTNLWPRTDVVELSTSLDLAGAVLQDEQGRLLPLQQRGQGQWIFIAKEVPPLSSRSYKILFARANTLPPQSSLQAGENEIRNAEVTVKVNPKTGAIEELISRRDGKNYASAEGLNAYIYSGRNAGNPVGNTSVTHILPVEGGPVASTLRITSQPAGTHMLQQDITLYEGIGRVDIRDVIDKTKSYEHENIRFAFPFNISNPETEIGLAFGRMRPEREQLSGANKNFYSVNNGVAVTGLKHSVLLTTIDCPILELGGMVGEAWREDTKEFLAWKRQSSSSATIYSWVMNNSWGTNYKASQEGKATFEYSIIPLEGDADNAKLKSWEIAQPLRAFVSDGSKPVETLFRLKGNNQIAVSTLRPAKDADGYILRLTNLSDRSVHTAFEWGSLHPTRIYECTNQEEAVGEVDAHSFWMKPYGTMTLKIQCKI